MKQLRWFIVPLALSLPLPALAAPPPGPSGARFEEKMHEMRSHMLRERVGLSEDKARRVEAILDKYAPERKKNHEEMRAAREKLRTLIDGKSEDVAQYKSALDTIRARKKATQELMDRAFDEVAKELTPKEQARLFLALEDMHGFGKGHRPDDGHEHEHGHGRGGPPGR